MKLIYGNIILLLACALCSCGLGDGTNGFDEVLYKPPFKSISDSIDQFPNNAALLVERAEMLSQNNRQEIAYYDFRKAWELQPNENTATLYASNLFMTGRNKEAIEFLKACITKYPSNPGFTRRLAEAYAQTGKNEEAIGLYNDLLTKDSSNFEALYEKGMMMTQLKDTAGAIATLESSYRQQPLMQTGLALAGLYAETKNARVVELCDALQKRDSARAFVDPVFLKGVYYSNVKDYPRAVALFDECMNRDWRFIEPYIEKGIIQYEQKNYDEAIKTFQFASKINYTNADACYWTGRCYEAIGKKDEAIDYYYQAVMFDRNFAEAKAAIKRLKK
jgi:tetratricopeptide (TPR) repeat protein